MSTTYGVSILLGLVAVVLSIVGGVRMLTAAQEAQLAADMSAIAAATINITGDAEDPCSVAFAIAESHHATVRSCTEENPEDFQVTVTKLGREATALAGPASGNVLARSESAP